MRRILVINAKGGCGKTTVATNLASLYARRGFGTVLFDCDPQASSLRWLRLREQSLPAIHGIAACHPEPMNVTRSWQLRLPEHTERVVVDSPGGIRAQDLAAHVRDVDVILIPVLPSPIDIFPTADFIRDLLLIGKVRMPRTRIGIVANRLRTNTLAFRALQRFLARLNIPVVAWLRDTQHYLHAAELGLGIHELDDRRALDHRAPWVEIFNWLEDGRGPRLTLVTPPTAAPDEPHQGTTPAIGRATTQSGQG